MVQSYNCRLPRNRPDFDFRPMQSRKQKILPEKRKLKRLQLFTVQLSKKRKVLRYSAELRTSIRMKQIFYDFVRSFEEKSGLKSKTLFKRLK